MKSTETGYREIGSRLATFENGLPSWLDTQKSTSGNGESVTVQSAPSRVQLTSGTGGDNYARVRSGAIDLTVADAVRMRAVFDLEPNAASHGNAYVFFGMQNSDDTNSVFHAINDGGGADDRKGKVIRIVDDTTYMTQTRDSIVETLSETELLWDLDDTVTNRYQDAFGRRITTDNLPDPSLDYELDFFIQQKNSDGTTQRVANVYEIELTYLKRID